MSTPETHKGPALSERDVACLRALVELADEAGLSRSAKGKRLDVSHLTWKQWRSAVAVLVARRLVEQRPGKRAEGEPDAYFVTAAGFDLCPRAGVGQGAGQGSGIPLVVDSSSQPQETEEQQPTPLPIAAREGQGVCPTLPDPALVVMDRLARSMERLGEVLGEALGLALVHRDLKPLSVLPSNGTHANAGQEQRALADSPSCACGPMAVRTRVADGAKFWACSTWTSAGGGCGAPTLSLEEAAEVLRASAPVPPPDPAVEAAREAAQRAREDREKADNEAHARQLAEAAERLRKQRGGKSGAASLVAAINGANGAHAGARMST